MNRQLGVHLHTGHGLAYAAISARGLGVELMQIMLGEAHSWTPYKTTADARNEFKKLSYGIAVYVHLPYTINPCLSENERYFKPQRSAYQRYLEAAAEVNARAVVIHPGFKKVLSDEAAKKNLICFMEDNPPAKGLRVLLETDAGSKNGSAIGSLEFIEECLAVLGRDQYGMVLDTEHLFARGIDLWEEQVRTEILDRHHAAIEMVHLNAPDPQVELGSHLDRHSISFEDLPRDSTPLLLDLLGRYPCVLERSSLVNAERDVDLIARLIEGRVAGIKEG